MAVFTNIHFEKSREESYTRTLWRWESADWEALRDDLRRTDREEVLCDNTDQQAERLT